jgi:prepilin-type N-terminal cleavage/methylation domain-containing protein
MKNININIKNRGFTLIEMLVVIAIIMILAGIVVTNFTSAKAKSRDAKRISDIAQIQLALEQYFDRCNEYPSATGNQIYVSSTCKSGGIDVKFSPDFISALPTPPSNNTNKYEYYVNHSTEATDYVLYTVLEKINQDVQKNGIIMDTEPRWYWEDLCPNCPYCPDFPSGTPTSDSSYCQGSK